MRKINITSSVVHNCMNNKNVFYLKKIMGSIFFILAISIALFIPYEVEQCMMVDPHIKEIRCLGWKVLSLHIFILFLLSIWLYKPKMKLLFVVMHLFFIFLFLMIGFIFKV